MIGVQAQGTWNAPEVPGVNPLSASGDLYLYNIDADAFVNYGMNWNTQATASRLLEGDTQASGRHLITVTVDGSFIKLSMKDKSDKNIFCGVNTVNDIWTDNTSNNPRWKATDSEKYANAYTLENQGHIGKNLDVQWSYGGRLTFDGGQGFTDWAFIPAASITDGSYIKYKERRAMYAIYKELADNSKVSTYADALSTANGVYVNSSATKDQLRAATRALLIAVADGIENPVNANALFTNADIMGNFAGESNYETGWGVTLAREGWWKWQIGDGTAELYHTSETLSQSQTDLPNGLYDVTFHGLYRQDGDSEKAPHLTVTGSNVLEDDLNTIGALQSLWAVGNGNANSGNWTAAGLPDGRLSAGHAQALGNATAAINNVQVKGNSLTIQLAVTGSNQWVLFQGFDIIYNGPINVAIYKRLMEKKGEAEALVGEPMDPTVLSNLEGCIAVAGTMTPNSDEDDLNNAYNNLVGAINDAEVSIDLTAHITAITDNKGDITSLINGTFQDNADGWNGGNRVTGLARGWRGADVTEPFYERTTAGVMSCTIPNMPAGTYKVVAAWRSINGGQMTPAIAGTDGTTVTGTGDAAPAERTKEINTNGVEMPYSSLGGFTTNANGHNWHWITATGTLAADGDLVLSFTTSGTAGWNAIDDVHLYCTNLGGTAYTRTVGDGKGTINANTSAVTVDIILENPNTLLRSTGKINTASGVMNNDQYNSSRITKLVLYDGYDFTNSGDNYGLDYGAILYRNIPADTWCTLAVPFYPNNLDVMKVPTSLAEGVLSFGDAPEKDMNDSPMLVKSTAGVTAITGTRTSTTGIAKGTLSYGEGAPMQGVYAAGKIPASTSGNAYFAVGDDNNLHKVTGSNVNIKPFRAYFTTSGEASARSTIALNFDDDIVTAINAIEATESETGAQKDGKYLENGKIVIVKNGIKYGTNGQKLN